MQVALQAMQIAWPIIEAIIKAIQAGKVDEFVMTVPRPLRSEVALRARDVLGE